MPRVQRTHSPLHGTDLRGLEPDHHSLLLRLNLLSDFGQVFDISAWVPSCKIGLTVDCIEFNQNEMILYSKCLEHLLTHSKHKFLLNTKCKLGVVVFTAEIAAISA